MSAPDWRLVTAQAAWSPRDSCGEAVWGGELWLLGGWNSSYEPALRDVWRSADGREWECVADAAPWEHGDLPAVVAFADRLWLMGGWQGGRLPGASASAAVWHTVDGARWTCATRDAGWSPRLGHAALVFQDRLYVLGGVERYYDGDARSLKNDIWRSADGVAWERVTDAAPWAPRAYHAAVVFDGALWLFGGGNYRPAYAGWNDIWRSIDGIAWERVTDAAPWSPRIWFASAIYRERLWLLGGWSDHPSRNWGDVWHTVDGVRWEALKTAHTWSARHEHAAWVFQDRLYVAGGNPWPLVNDVWELALPEEAK